MVTCFLLNFSSQISFIYDLCLATIILVQVKINIYQSVIEAWTIPLFNLSLQYTTLTFMHNIDFISQQLTQCQVVDHFTSLHEIAI